MSGMSFDHMALHYLATINVVAFLAYGLDKYKARHGRWRISEAMLLFMAVIDGSVGAWLGMRAWHHKTRKGKFRYGVPAIIAVQVLLSLMLSCTVRRHAEYAEPQPQGSLGEHSPSVFLVMYDKEIGKDSLLEAVREHKAKVVYDHSIIPSMAIRKPEGKNLEEAMHLFRTVKRVVTVEYGHVLHLTNPVRPRLEMR